MATIRAVDPLGRSAFIGLADLHPGDAVLLMRPFQAEGIYVESGAIGEVAVAHADSIELRVQGRRAWAPGLSVVGYVDVCMKPGDLRVLVDADDPRLALLGGAPEEVNSFEA